MAPPGTASRTASHGPESPDWLDAHEKETFDLRAGINQLFPQLASDPTMRKALRRELGWFEPDAELHLRIKSKARGNIDVRLDYEFRNLVIELIEKAANVSLTQSGRSYRARLKKKNPGAVDKFGDSDSSGAHTNTTN